MCVAQIGASVDTFASAAWIDANKPEGGTLWKYGTVALYGDIGLKDDGAHCGALPADSSTV